MKRSPLKIKVWLLENGISQAEIGRILGMYRSAINACIHSRRDNPKILAYLLKIGVPESALGLPESFDRKEAFEKLNERLLEIKGRKAA